MPIVVCQRYKKSSAVAGTGAPSWPSVIVHPFLYRPSASEPIIRTDFAAQLHNRLNSKRTSLGKKHVEDRVLKSAEPLMGKLENVGCSTYARNVSWDSSACPHRGCKVLLRIAL